MRREHHGRAMGGALHIVVIDGPPGLIDAAVQRVTDLERRWTRFAPTSELSRLNASAGTPTFVSPETAHLVERACTAWERSGGAFDPTVYDSIVALGYDGDLPAVRRRVSPATPSTPAPGCADIAVDVASGYVYMPAGVRFDPGGIGKGLAADLIAAAIVAAGATGALVNVGGDLRTTGQAPPDGWRIGVEDPHRTTRRLATLTMTDGAVATSSTLKRRWMTTGGMAHHLIDPRIGQPVDSVFDTITVVTREAWWAEAMTKALMVTPVADWSELITDEHVLALRPDGSIVERGVLAAGRGPRRASGRMNDRIWWHVARSTGLVAWLALALAMVTGGMLANRMIRHPASVRRTVGLHRHLAAVGLGLVAVHLGALLADDYVEFSVGDLLIPLRSSWRPGALAWGIVAIDLLIVVEVSSLAHRRLSKRTWRLVHQCSVLGFASATVHLLNAGTDASAPMVRLPVVAITVVVTFLYLGRLVRLRTHRPSSTAVAQVTPPRHDQRGGVRLSHDNDVASRKSLVQGQ